MRHKSETDKGVFSDLIFTFQSKKKIKKENAF